MDTFQNKFDSLLKDLIKDFCKEIATVYNLDERELFLLWNKGETEKPVIKKPSSSSTNSSSSSSSSSKVEKESVVSKPENQEKSSEDPDLEITKEKILVANKDVLAAMCKKKGLKMSGKKDDLVQRLIESLSSTSSASSASSSVSKTSSKKEESSIIRSLKSTISDIAIRKNKYGNFEHMQTGLVFGLDKKVYGRQVEGEVVPLTTDDIETCKRYKFLCKLPENLNVNKSLDDIKIDDVEQDEDDLDDEELVEDIEDEDDEVIDEEDK